MSYVYMSVYVYVYVYQLDPILLMFVGSPRLAVFFASPGGGQRESAPDPGIAGCWGHRHGDPWEKKGLKDVLKNCVVFYMNTYILHMYT